MNSVEGMKGILTRVTVYHTYFLCCLELSYTIRLMGILRVSYLTPLKMDIHSLYASLKR